MMAACARSGTGLVVAVLLLLARPAAGAGAVVQRHRSVDLRARHAAGAVSLVSRPARCRPGALRRPPSSISRRCACGRSTPPSATSRRARPTTPSSPRASSSASGLSTTVSGGEMRVLQVFDGSPAAEAGLERGARIDVIDGRAVAGLIASGDSDGAFGPAQAGLEVTIAFRRRDGERRTATVRKRAVTIPTVSLTRVFDVGGRKVGYLFFRNFVRPSVAALDEAFAALREAGVERAGARPALQRRRTGGRGRAPGQPDRRRHGARSGVCRVAPQRPQPAAQHDPSLHQPAAGAAPRSRRGDCHAGVGVGQRAGHQRPAAVHASGDRGRPHLRQAGRAVCAAVLRQGVRAGVVCDGQCRRRAATTSAGSPPTAWRPTTWSTTWDRRRSRRSPKRCGSSAVGACRAPVPAARAFGRRPGAARALTDWAALLNAR